MLATYQQRMGGSSSTQWSPEDASLDQLISELDFFTEPSLSSSASPAASVMSTVSSTMNSEACDADQGRVGKKPSKDLPKSDYAVDYLDQKVLHAMVHPKQVEEKNSFPCKLVTSFKKKYFRFDNKSLQCFPQCSRFDDVREARMLGQDHRIGGRGESFCTNGVTGAIMVPLIIPNENIVVVGRFLSATPEVGVLPESDAPLLEVGTIVARVPQANCVLGAINGTSKTDTYGRRELIIEIQPEESWLFNMTLPRHRRNATCAAHKVPLFAFEMLVLVRQDNAYQVCARAVSNVFEVASIRTLIRESLAFRQQQLPNHQSSLKSIIEDDVDMESEARNKTPEKPAPTMTTRRHLAANYSSTAQRVRLAEATRRGGEKKKKQELMIEIVPEPEAAMEIVQPLVPAANFSIPTFAMAPNATTFTPVAPLPSFAPSNDISFDILDFLASDSFVSQENAFEPAVMSTFNDNVDLDGSYDDDIP